MWYSNENGDLVRPSEIDRESSRKYVYVRKNIEEVEATEDIPAHYRWQEIKIPQADWAVYEKVIDHDGTLDDVQNALIELAEIIVGE